MGTPLDRPLRVNGEHADATLQRKLPRSHMRRRQLLTPPECRLTTRSDLLQTTLGSITRNNREATAIKSGNYRIRTTLAQRAVVIVATQHGSHDHPLPRVTRPLLFMATRLVQGDRAATMERRGFSTTMPAWLHTRLGVIGLTLRTTSPRITDLRPLAQAPPGRPRNARYPLREATAQAP
jgi:hypothetical protein